MEAEYQLVTLNNGIRIVHKQIDHTRIAHVGLMLDIGSRDETEDEQGLAHFWEHMAFKGTTKRKAYHILNRLESLGGELNAYTTKEKICFYASVLNQHLNKAVELISDITFHSTFPEKQIEREKGVILEEMALYRDMPEDSLQDDFDEILFKDHPLGKNILGTEETVSSFKQSHFRDFIAKHLDTHKVILSSVGSFSINKIVKLAEKYLGDIPEKQTDRARKPFANYQPATIEISKPISQAHCAIGRTSYSLQHPDRIKLFTLLNILGGPGMNSRLNLTLREKYGYVYGIDASYSPFPDTGALGIYFATEKKNLKKSIQLIWREFDRVKTYPLGKLQLHAAKQQLKGQMAMSEENYSGMMLMMAKSLLDLGEIIGLDIIFAKIDEITSEDLLKVANDVLDREEMSILSYLSE
ncbi:MAG: pitrilysin family protein [Cyclobacteriaceae bacterium]